MYSEKVLDHFHHPRNVGEIEHPTAVAETANPVCGDVLKLWIVAGQGRIERAAFKAQGCVPVVACGSLVAETIEGKSLEQLRALTPQDVEKALGGLPPASRHAAALAIDALKKVLAQLER
jgi:nitrogen fixation protein NifU and related proteins